MRIEFAPAEDLLRRPYALSHAIVDDYDCFQTAVQVRSRPDARSRYVFVKKRLARTKLNRGPVAGSGVEET